MRQPDEAHHHDGPDDEQRDVLGDAPGEAARVFDAPDEVEAVLDLLDGAKQGPQQQRETHRTDQAGAHAVGEFHDAMSEIRGAGRTQRAEEFLDQGTQLAMRAEGLEHRERERDQGYQRQQRRVDQAHGVEIDVAAREIAQDGVGITQHAQRHRAWRIALGILAEEITVEPVPERDVHRGPRISGPPGAVTIRLTRMAESHPTRIVCLTEETTETLYLLGEERRIVGISGFTVRPPRARREKPKVSAFISAKIDKIVALEPDLVLGFSDLQADIAAELIRAGIEVHVFNHRSVAEILRMIATLGGMVGCAAKADALIGELQLGLEEIRRCRRAIRAPSAGLFRRVGRAADIRHSLGIRAHRNRGRR